MPERESKLATAVNLCDRRDAIAFGPRRGCFLLVTLWLAGALGPVRSETAPTRNSLAPILKSNDVIAFVGGEDVVAMQQHGYVEALLARETATKNLRFRNLGWEGDTVFEQRRELNFPSWEQVLSRIGATVVIAQFGQAESLGGRDAIPQFRQAAVNLLGRLTGTNREVIVLAPTSFEQPSEMQLDLAAHNETLRVYSDELKRLCRINQWRFVESIGEPSSRRITRDGLHLNSQGHWRLAVLLAAALHVTKPARSSFVPATSRFSNPEVERLRQAILAKNQLWFDYWRPQNWAFLAGDRTEQPSSRDHRNPKIRWFPDELEQFLPLIEAKEREVKRLAEKLP